MPEGLEKDFKPQDLADIMAYVASTGPSRKTFPATPTIVTVSPGRHAGARRDQLRDLRRFARLTKAVEAAARTGTVPNDRAVWTADMPKSGTLHRQRPLLLPERRGRQPLPIRVAADQRITCAGGGDRQGLGTSIFPVEIGKIRLKEGRQRFTCGPPNRSRERSPTCNPCC